MYLFALVYLACVLLVYFLQNPITHAHEVHNTVERRA